MSALSASRTGRDPSAPSAAPARVEVLRTPAGIEVWHVEDYTVPLVSLQFAFIGGAANDPEALPGLSHVLSGLLDEGAGDLSGALFKEKLEEKAIEIGFDAGRDRFAGSMRTLSRHAEDAFALLALALNAPRFDAEAVERVKAQVVASLRRDENEPQVVARDLFYGRAFPGHPYARPTAGTPATVAGIGRDAIAACHRSLFARSNLRMAAVGAIDGPTLSRLVDAAFAPLPAGPDLRPVTDVDLSGRGGIGIRDLAVPQSTLLFALPGLKRKDPDFAAATVVNHIFGGGSFTSRLWTEVREKRGLAYSVWAQLAPSRHAQLLIGGTATSNERIAESLSVIEGEVRRMAEAGIPEDELAKAKSYLIGSYALRFDTSRKIATHLVDIQVEDLGLDHLANRNAEIAAVDGAAARAVAERLFGDPRLTVAVAGRPKGIAARDA